MTTTISYILFTRLFVMRYQPDIRSYGISYLKQNLLVLSYAFAKNAPEIQL